MKRYLSILFLTSLLISCTVDKVNLSPLSSSFSGYSSTSNLVHSTSKSMETVSYTSELSNLISEFPAFSNNKMNMEIQKLKTNITDYIYAVKSNNSLGQKSAYKQYSDSYKNIQKLKSELSPEEIELLNRFLVKIKTNISLIDSINLNRS